LWDKGYLELAKARVDRVVRQARVFSISGNNKGLWCPFKPIFCQEGYCEECQVYLDWLQERGEVAVICAWCGKEMGRKPGLGETGISHSICPECMQKYFPGLRQKSE